MLKQAYHLLVIRYKMSFSLSVFLETHPIMTYLMLLDWSTCDVECILNQDNNGNRSRGSVRQLA
jgi:hypothetical protein